MRSRPTRIILTAAVLSAAAVGIWWFRDASRERRFRAEHQAARRDLAAGRPHSAAQRLRRLLLERPGRTDWQLDLGRAELARGREAEALDALKAIPPDAPEAPRAAALRSRIEIQGGRLGAAEALLVEALQAPKSRQGDAAGRLDARDALVRLLRSEGRFDEARRVFLEGFDDWPDPVAALKALHRLDTDPFPTEGVRVYLDNAAKKAPDDDRAWLGRAHLETVLGRFDEARRWLDACLKKRPIDPAVWRARLDWALASGRVDEARRTLVHLPAEPALAAEVDTWFAATRGDRAAEASALERRLAVRPGLAAAWNRLAEIHAEAGRPGEAARDRDRAAALNHAKESYESLLKSARPREKAAELAELAAVLGLGFEADRWAALAGKPRSASPFESKPPAGRTLADLVTERDGPAAPESAAATGARVAFRDDAGAAGLTFTHDNGASADPTRLIPPVSACGGVALLDFDGDGWLDVYCVQGGPFPAGAAAGQGDRLFRNKGDGTFEDVSTSTGIAALTKGYGHGVAVGDFDGDGRPDLFVTRWRSYALYRNKGDGTFEDATETAGLGGDRDWPTSAAFADFDNDGDLDLYVCHYFRWDENDPRPCADPRDPAVYHCNPLAFPAEPDHVFRNDGGRFADVSEASGVTAADRDGRGLGVVAADLDGDGLVDLFVANDMTANYLFKNLGGFRFEDRALDAGVSANAGGGYQAGMGVACGDLDADGLPDLVVTNFYGESTSFFKALRAGSLAFADRSAASGLAAASRDRLGFGVGLPDADLDGRLDLLTANGHIHDGRPQFPFLMRPQLFLGAEGGRLVDVTERAGAPFRTGHLGRGLAVGDLDNDGRDDALLVAQNEPVVYLHNRTADAGHWLTLGLVGRGRSNRDAVGAVVTVAAGGRRRVLLRNGGGSYQSAGDPRVHAGLGASTAAESVEVRWPSGRTDRHENLPADAGYLLVEGDPRPRPLPGFPVPKSANPPPLSR